ncbi:phage tail tape measure protein [Lentilactobacillus parabuchneri]|jgi:TP901 family phage tail tape measure protein|uniref:phage tail tape measure protein n=2 Tax=Lentilactobacillus parabuchneri TaxID=152331 RepID=UPI000A0FFECA|nr:phage tail tape measure protein [Lentilactobacillus parabuchneri]ORM91146.1 Phage-related minor tail protein [Lentilactobacillus parabuchneri]ORN13658.1 Phage-related minor tail protein [Lentilactobacillus parabuchneri]ORN15428.1 Phage-related minor tail protein [Lentilactobacillus parabuchneri]ORN18393.1 Phage-related minor tail protein [Lentilactobacillus parabuchneri]
MADSPYRVGYDIRAKVDYSQIKDATKAAGELINKLQKVQDLQKGRTAGSTGDSMKSAMRSTAQETQNVTNKAKTAAEAQAKLADQMKKTANSGKSMKSTAETIQTVGNHSKTAAGQVNILQRSITKVKNVGTQSFQAISDHVRRFGETSEATRKKLDRLNETGKKFRDVGYNMLPTSVAVGAAFLKGAKDATVLQHKYTIIKNLLETSGEGVQHSIKATSEMQERGAKLSMHYGVAQQQVAAGYEELVRRGYTANQALAAQKTMVQGSIASGDDYTDVVHNATAAIESFGMRSKNTTTMTANTKKAVNQMAYAADLTATDFKGMGNALQYVGAISHGANQSLSETASAIGILSNNGQEASVAGTGLRQVLSRLTNPPAKGKYVGAMKQLGLSPKDFKDSKGNLLSLQDIFAKINKTMSAKNLTGTGKTSIYGALFGQTGMTTAKILGANVKQMKSLNEQVEKAGKYGGSGYVAQLAEKNRGSWQNQINIAQMGLKQIGMTFAKDVLPTLTPALMKVTRLMEKFADLPKPMRKFITYTGLAVAAIGPLAITLGSVVSGVAALGGGLAKIKPLLTAGGVIGGTKAGKAKVAGKSSPLSVLGQFSGGTSESQAKKSGATFAKSASKGISKGATTGGKKFNTKVSKGTTAAGNASGKKFSYHVKEGAVTGGNSGGKKFGKYVRDAGNSAGTTGGSRFSSKIRGLGWASLGLAVGVAALKRGKVGEAAGEGLGAGIGGYLGGPAGAMIGSYIGGKIGAALDPYIKAAYKAVDKNIKSYDKKNGKGSYKKLASNPYDGLTGGKQQTKSESALRARLRKANPTAGYASGGLIAKKQTALVGEGGPELAYTVNGRQARLLGAAGPQFAKVKPGERILNAHDTAKVMGGGLGHVLPGYANGTSTLGRTAKTSDKDVKAGLNKVAKDYDSTTKKSKKSLDKFSKNSKSAWNGVTKDTKSRSQKIQKNTVGDYDDLQKGSIRQLGQLQSGNNSQWKSILNQTGKRTNSLRKSTVSDFNSMQQGSQKQMNQLESGIIAAAKATAIGFGKEMGRMKAYAHAAMNGAIGQLNQGISGIDSVLSQFGGNKAVIKPIKFAHGSNGHLTENQMAMVNDAAAGPRQEAIVRNNNIYLPKGNNRIMPLLKGDQVLNGRQTQQITHYAKGSGVSDSALEKIVDAGQKNPGKSFNQNFNVHIDVKGSQLQKGTTELEKNASQKYGKPWIGAMWKVVGDQMDSAGSGVRSAFLKYAMQHFTGKPYLMGGLGPKYYDCSGMVYSALKHFGINIGRDTVSMQNSSGVQNLGHKRSAVKQGDLIIYGHGGGAAGHVGIIDNPTKGTMFNETPPRARVTSIFPPMSMGYDYFRIKGLKDSDKQSKATSVSSRLYKLAKSELGKSAIGNLQKRFADQSAAGGPVPKGDHMHWLEQAGMPRSWWSYVSAIINRESKWDPKANNPTSSAYGIPQALPGSKMRSAGSDWRTNPITQLRWMKSYIKDRYGSAQNAWRIRQTRGWYANGGWSKDKQLNIFGEVAGQREVAINPKRKSADNLIDQTIEARATADKSSPSADYLNSIKALKVKQSRPKIEPKITLNFNGDISDEKTMNKAVDKFKRGLTDVLTQINDEFGLDDSVW